MLASCTASYSRVSGAFWALPHAFDGSNGGCPPTGGRTASHWPEKSGYLPSSKAPTADAEASKAASASIPIELRASMFCPPCRAGGEFSERPARPVPTQRCPAGYMRGVLSWKGCGAAHQGWPGETCFPRRRTCGVGSAVSLPEVLEVGRRLVLVRRHEDVAVALHVEFVPDLHQRGDGRTIFVAPVRIFVGTAPVRLKHRPRLGEGVVEERDLIVDKIRNGLVGEDALLDHGLVVGMRRNTGGVQCPRPFEVPGLDLEHVIAAISVLVDPLADRMALV